MRYLVTARVRPGLKKPLRRAILARTLGAGSIAGDEYLRNMGQARILENGKVRWVEVCFCESPLQEERPYWEEYFELLDIKGAHNRNRSGLEWSRTLGLFQLRLHGSLGATDAVLGSSLRHSTRRGRERSG